MRPQPLSSLATAFSRFSCRSTPVAPLNRPASQPGQPVSSPDNNNNCTGNFKGSRGIATFVVIFPSRFQWRERNIAATSGHSSGPSNSTHYLVSSSSGTPCSTSQSSGTLVVPLNISTYISFDGPSVVSTLPPRPLQT